MGSFASIMVAVSNLTSNVRIDNINVTVRNGLMVSPKYPFSPGPSTIASSIMTSHDGSPFKLLHLGGFIGVADISKQLRNPPGLIIQATFENGTRIGLTPKDGVITKDDDRTLFIFDVFGKENSILGTHMLVNFRMLEQQKLSKLKILYSSVKEGLIVLFGFAAGQKLWVRTVKEQPPSASERHEPPHETHTNNHDENRSNDQERRQREVNGGTPTTTDGRLPVGANDWLPASTVGEFKQGEPTTSSADHDGNDVEEVQQPAIFV